MRVFDKVLVYTMNAMIMFLICSSQFLIVNSLFLIASEIMFAALLLFPKTASILQPGVFSSV